MNIETETITCCSGECGISFEVPKWWYVGKAQTHGWFYCPNGHKQYFPGESKEEELRRERDIARQQVARAEEQALVAVRRAETAERETKRIRKRAAAGTCPCCQRTFANMAAHMKTEHPTFMSNVVSIKDAS